MKVYFCVLLLCFERLQQAVQAPLAVRTNTAALCNYHHPPCQELTSQLYAIREMYVSVKSPQPIIPSSRSVAFIKNNCWWPKIESLPLSLCHSLCCFWWNIHFTLMAFRGTREEAGVWIQEEKKERVFKYLSVIILPSLWERYWIIWLWFQFVLRFVNNHCELSCIVCSDSKSISEDKTYLLKIMNLGSRTSENCKDFKTRCMCHLWVIKTEICQLSRNTE